MKKILVLMVLSLVVTFSLKAQCGTTALLSGCVGACGSSYTASYTVTAADVGPFGVGVFCLYATSNSLCPSDIAYATLQRNGNLVGAGDISNGAVLACKATVGMVLTVTVYDIFVNPNINCFWQGETHFSLFR
jgi:hypothetical protein